MAFGEQYGDLGAAMEYKGVDESLKFIVKTLSEMKEDVAELQAKIDLQTYTLKELAARLGYKNVQTLRNKPWLMPNFGKADIGTVPRRWLNSTVMAWYSISEIERQGQWELMSSRERRAALGITELETAKKTPPDISAKKGEKNTVPRAG